MKLLVKVVPGASADRIVGWLGEALKVRVTAPPEGGKANRAVEGLLTRRLGIPKSAARIVSGSRSARKIVEISGLSAAELKCLLSADTN
jgi:uncharacterized protein (TIGR00251 family)